MAASDDEDPLALGKRIALSGKKWSTHSSSEEERERERTGYGYDNDSPPEDDSPPHKKLKEEDHNQHDRQGRLGPLNTRMSEKLYLVYLKDGGLLPNDRDLMRKTKEAVGGGFRFIGINSANVPASFKDLLVGESSPAYILFKGSTRLQSFPIGASPDELASYVDQHREAED